MFGPYFYNIIGYLCACTCTCSWIVWLYTIINKLYDTALQTQDTKSRPWWSKAVHATSRSWRLSTILNLYERGGRNICFFETWMPVRQTVPRALDFPFQPCSFNRRKLRVGHGLTTSKSENSLDLSNSRPSTFKSPWSTFAFHIQEVVYYLLFS